MEIKAADVAKLRQMTGAGMMDCKKALVEAEGDFERAKEIIREKGKLVAAKRADRETSEGAVIAKVNGGKAIVVGLGCETDFVAKNAEFQALAEAIAEAAIADFPADKEALMACVLADGRTVEAAVTEQTGKTGEKHQIAGYEVVEAPYIVAYMHNVTGKLAAVVGFNKEFDAQVAKGVAMQVASMNPVAVSAESVPQSVIDTELKTATEKTKEELVQKAVDAALNKAFDEQTAKGVAMQVASMNPVAVSAESVPQSVIDTELKTATEKTKEELVQKAVDAALSKAGINPAHVDSEAHIESNTAKGWITPEQAEQAREIIKTVSAEKAANLPEQMVANIAKGRLQKFFKEQTLEEQGYQMGDGKTAVKDVIKAADAEAKVLVFKRLSLAD